uniref:MULE transposase domain-containing protein n=1 Tax=Ditylenchus dipsaci TaxID=166011 RepID=A0A915EUW0_9BILA
MTRGTVRDWQTQAKCSTEEQRREWMMQHELRWQKLQGRPGKKWNTEEFVCKFSNPTHPGVYNQKAIPVIEDAPYCIGFGKREVPKKHAESNYSEWQFFLIFITRRLMNKQHRSNIVRTDATYKLNLLGYPVAGFSDANKRFHPTVIGICSSESKFAYEGLFNAIKYADLQNLYHPKLVVRDADTSIICRLAKFRRSAMLLSCHNEIEEETSKGSVHRVHVNQMKKRFTLDDPLFDGGQPAHGARGNACGNGAPQNSSPKSRQNPGGLQIISPQHSPTPLRQSSRFRQLPIRLIHDPRTKQWTRSRVNLT